MISLQQDQLSNCRTDYLSVDITYTVSSEDILKEIYSGNAEYVSIVSCRETYYRKVLNSNERMIHAEFPSGSFRGEVRVDPYIVVKHPISEFASADINEEFGGATFAFSPGEVLAQDETQIFYVDRDLFKPVTSVFELVKNDSLSGGEWKVGLEEDHVQIEVSSAMKDLIDSARNVKSHQVVLLNSIYFASVVQALQRLKDNGGDFESKKWAEVMRRQIHNFGWDLNVTEPYVMAQRLMKYPLALFGTYVFDGCNR